jgi:hypothetical protein
MKKGETLTPTTLLQLKIDKEERRLAFWVFFGGRWGP